MIFINFQVPGSACSCIVPISNGAYVLGDTVFDLAGCPFAYFLIFAAVVDLLFASSTEFGIRVGRGITALKIAVIETINAVL